MNGFGNKHIQSNKMKYTSIIVTSYIPNEMRERMFYTSLTTLIDSTKERPVEIIVCDNGGNKVVTEYLNNLVNEKKIHCLIRNSENMHFGFARNQALAMAHGDYICIADNDIEYLPDWLDTCIAILDIYDEKKIYATPIDYPRMARRYHVGELDFGNFKLKLSMRAGSNCWVMRRRDYQILGGFQNHRVAGTKWTTMASRAGYLAAVTPQDMVMDLGIHRGYNLKECLPIKRTLLNGKEVYFNQDEFKEANPKLNFYE